MDDGTNSYISPLQIVVYFTLAGLFSLFFRIVHFEGLQAWLVLKDRPLLEFPYVAIPGTAEAREMANAQLGNEQQAKAARVKLATRLDDAIERSCKYFDRIVLHTSDADMEAINRVGCDVAFRATFAVLLEDAPSTASQVKPDQAATAPAGSNAIKETGKPRDGTSATYRFVRDGFAGGLVFFKTADNVFDIELQTLSMKSGAKCVAGFQGAKVQDAEQKPPELYATWRSADSSCEIRIGLYKGAADFETATAGCATYCEATGEFTGLYEHVPEPPR